MKVVIDCSESDRPEARRLAMAADGKYDGTSFAELLDLFMDAAAGAGFCRETMEAYVRVDEVTGEVLKREVNHERHE